MFPAEQYASPRCFMMSPTVVTFCLRYRASLRYTVLPSF